MNAADTTTETRYVAVVVRPFELVDECRATPPGSFLRPGTLETREVQPGTYDVKIERCACGEAEAIVTVDAVLVSRTTGPLWRRRTQRTERVATTAKISGNADDIHDGMDIATDGWGRLAARFEEVEQ